MDNILEELATRVDTAESELVKSEAIWLNSPDQLSRSINGTSSIVPEPSDDATAGEEAGGDAAGEAAGEAAAEEATGSVVGDTLLDILPFLIVF